MSTPTEHEELVALFARLGASEPESWASSQLDEGLPQLLRFLFLRQAWAGLVQPGDTSWIETAMEQAQATPDAPFAGLGLALHRCLTAGVNPADLTEIARCLQAQALFHICYTMEDPVLELDELADVSWGLFQTDSEGNPAGPAISALHESVLETEPAGREMRPPYGTDTSGGA